jgi:hypothetical protein
VKSQVSDLSIGPPVFHQWGATLTMGKEHEAGGNGSSNPNSLVVSTAVENVQLRAKLLSASCFEVLPRILYSRYYYPHLGYEKIEPHRGLITWPRCLNSKQQSGVVPSILGGDILPLIFLWRKSVQETCRAACSFLWKACDVTHVCEHL